ncbi:hypothetical protein EGW08_005137 [Elysia chlorotica]|uniref:Uncharacterized protein n=1 Tax=Elysia chlorotica TaxID=188477 RepID=A0A433TZQ0_ELYCH|nr:hypothetical protein EGW08_005137 [Elysia chlorotica]
MIPHSRGKRMLEMSRQKAKRAKENLPLLDTVENTEKTGDADVSVLNIPTSQLLDVSEDVNMSFSFSEFSDLDLPVSEISSSLKVANFVLNHADVPLKVLNDTVNPASYSSLGQSNIDTPTTILRAEERAENYTAASYDNQLVEEPVEVDTVIHAIEPSNSLRITSSIDPRASELVGDHEVASGVERVVDEPVEAGTVIQPIEPIELTNLEASAGNNLDGQDETTDEIDAQRKTKKKTKKQDKKENREHGKAYLGRYYDKEKKTFVEVMKEAKVLGDRCKCKAAYHHCKEISDQDRAKIFSDVWKMTWGEKEVFVKMAIETKDVKERKGSESSKRDRSLVFNLRGSSGSRRVCKDMFLKTTPDMVDDSDDPVWRGY